MESQAKLVREEAARRYDDGAVQQSFVGGWASKDDPEIIEVGKTIPDETMREAFLAGVEYEPGA